MKAVIMAGGEGTRLRPLTCDAPKPLAKIMGIPVMEHIIELLKSNNITDIAVTLGYLPTEIINYFGDGKKFGVALTYFEEKEALGTAGGVKNCEKFLDTDFIVISGDCLCDFDLKKAISYHKKKNGICTILLKSVKTPYEYGVTVTDEQGKIVRFIEKPGALQAFTDTVNTGIYICKKDILKDIPKGKKYDFSKDLFKKLLDNHIDLFGYEAEGYWCDIGDIDAYRQCHFDVQDCKVFLNSVTLSEKKDVKAKIYPPVYIEEGVTVADDAEIGPYVVIGKGTTVESGAQISHSVILTDCFIGKNSEIKGAVLCEGAVTLDNSRVFEGSVLGARCIVGQGATVMQSTSIWPDKKVDNNITLSHNIIWGDSARELFCDGIISGKFAGEINSLFATRLGLAVGSAIDESFFVGHDGSNEAELIATSLSCGLIGAGIEVCDFKMGAYPLLCYACNINSTFGAFVEVRDSIVSIRLCSNDGIFLDRARQRSIENNFSKQTFKKCDNVPKLLSSENLESRYTRYICSSFSELSNINVYINCENVYLKNLFAKILQKLCVNITENKENTVGLFLSYDGTACSYCDEKGTMLSPRRSLSISCLSLLTKGDVAIMYDSPRTIDQIAKERGKKVLRVLLESDGSDKKAREKLKEIPVSRDGIYAALSTLSYLKKEGASLYQLSLLLPEFYEETKTVEIPQSEVGYVLRSLCDGATELTEGILIEKEDSSVLIRPKPTVGFTIRSEAKDMEVAEELCVEFENKIKNLLQ